MQNANLKTFDILGPNIRLQSSLHRNLDYNFLLSSVLKWAPTLPTFVTKNVFDDFNSDISHFNIQAFFKYVCETPFIYQNLVAIFRQILPNVVEFLNSWLTATPLSAVRSARPLPNGGPQIQAFERMKNFSAASKFGTTIDTVNSCPSMKWRSIVFFAESVGTGKQADGSRIRDKKAEWPDST